MDLSRFVRNLIGIAASLAVVAAVGCGPDAEVGDAVRLEAVTTGWLDVGPLGTQNKLVPMVSFKVKNATGRTLAPIHVNAVFRRVGDSAEWSNGMVTAAGSQGLPAAAATDRLVIKGDAGYTGSDSQWELLKNSHFVDARVDVFARYGSRQWARVGVFPIARQVVER
jgi:hypothetical protein